MNRFVALVALYLFIIQFALAQKPDASLLTDKQIASKADEYMNESVKIDNFHGAVLVARDGKAIFSKAYGMANYELDVPNKPQTVFHIVSMTKQFTAMAIIILQERGKLSVNESICKYLEDCPTAWQPITIRHLLTNTSGIVNYHDLPEWGKVWTCRQNPKEFIKIFKDKPLEFPPGERFAYSNSGWYLLGLIIEKTSGKDYDEFLEENIFAPLGMKNTREIGYGSFVKNRADGYVIQGERIISQHVVDWSVLFSAGSLLSTTEDMLLWEQAHNTEKLVSRKSLDEIFTPFKDFLPGLGYAYGWMVRRNSERPVMSHSGSMGGFASYIVRHPADRITIVVLGNKFGSPSGSIGNALSAIALGKPHKSPNERKMISVEQQILDKYVGQYQLTPDVFLSVTTRNKNLFGGITGLTKTGTGLPLYANSETKFFFTNLDAQVTFIKDAQGKVTGLTMHSGGRDMQAQKIK